MGAIHKGSPYPLGNSLTKNGVNFSVACPSADYLELLIFQNENDQHPKKVIKLDENHKSDDYWHVEIEGLRSGAYYCYRVVSLDINKFQRNYSKKLLLDPCARGIKGWEVFDRNCATGQSSNQENCLKGVVTERELFDFKSYPRPNHSWDKTIIYLSLIHI